MRYALLVAIWAHNAAAQCQLGPPTPIAGLRQQRIEQVPWGYLAPILTGEYGAPYTVVDVLDPRRRAQVGNGAKLAVTTPSRGVAIEPYQRGKLFAGRLQSSLAVIHEADELRPVLDAVDGAAGETWIVLKEKNELNLYRLDGVGKLSRAATVTRRAVMQARLTRLADGRLAVAYAAFSGGRRYGVSTLELVWLDPRGKPGDPLRLDAVVGQEQVLDVALAPSAKGVVVAWNPILRVPKGKVESVPVELRAFQVAPGVAPRLTRRDALQGLVWRIPEAGGVLPNQLQAASVGGRAVLIWQQLASPESMALVAAPAEGGAVSTLLSQLPGDPLLRRDGNQLVIAFWDRAQYRHQRAVLTCSPAAPGPSPAPLDALPAEPSLQPLTRADLDNAWKHVEQLLGKPLALSSDEKADAERKLTSDQGRFECVHACVMAARDLDELHECGWL